MEINIKSPVLKRYIIKDKEPLIIYDYLVKDLTEIFLKEDLLLFKGNFEVLHDKYILNYCEENNKKIEDLNKKEKRELKEFIIKEVFKIITKEDFIYLMFKKFYGKEEVYLQDFVIRFLETLGNKYRVRFSYKMDFHTNFIDIEFKEKIKVEIEEVEEKISTEKEKEFKRSIRNDFNINIF